MRNIWSKSIYATQAAYSLKTLMINCGSIINKLSVQRKIYTSRYIMAIIGFLPVCVKIKLVLIIIRTAHSLKWRN